MSQEKTTVKCVYAGDPEDINCKDCGGYEIYQEGTFIGAAHIKCEGYEPSPEVEDVAEPCDPTEDTVEETVEEVTEAEDVPSEEPVREVASSPQSITKTVTEDYISQAAVTEIRAGSSCTLEIKEGDINEWHRFEYSETRVLPPNLDDESVEIERGLLWDTVNEQIYSQIDYILR